MGRDEDALVVCEQCGQAHRWLPLERGALARCSRCDAVLGRGRQMSIETVLALTVTAAVVYVVAITSPVIDLSLNGVGVTATLPEAVGRAWREGQAAVAVTAGFTAVVAPALFIALRLYILAPLAAGRKAPGFAACVRALHQVSRWSMVEVFTIGALLSLVRLAGLADAAPGPALFALGTLTLLFAGIESAGLRHLWWHVR